MNQRDREILKGLHPRWPSDLWFKDVVNRQFTEAERTEHVLFLKGLFEDLMTEDPVRWEERGILPQLWTTPHAREDARGRILNLATWRIGTTLRFASRVRLDEGLEALEWCLAHNMEVNKGSTMQDDPILCIWVCVAREMRGGNKAYLERILNILKETPLKEYGSRVGNKNYLLGRSCRARLYLKLNKSPLAEKEIQAIAKWIQENPVVYTPSVFKQNVGEEIYKHVTRVLGRDPYAGFKEIDQYTMTKAGSPFLMVTEPGRKPDTRDGHIPQRPFEADKRTKQECWVSGCRKSDGLQICSKCKVAKYCSRGHRVQAWPRHKQLCSTYKRDAGILGVVLYALAEHLKVKRG